MSKSSKRPSSARRNIKLETFSSFASCSRLRKVQNLLRVQHGARSSNPDAILCVAGIDGRYNEGTTELINYLLFGFFEVRKTELEKSGFEEEVIDDLIFLIKRNEVHVYCNPINYRYLLPYISHWRNIRFHCLTETEYEDEEAAEEFKIQSFISMVQGCQVIGIPYTAVGHTQSFDKLQVEKWPIIQAYALEDYGGGGFFTLKNEVIDVGDKLHIIYDMIDPVTLEVMITDQLALFERQWNTMLSTMDVDMLANPRSITEEKISEPLMSYFVHGRVGSHDSDKRYLLPYILFGSNSRKSVMDSVAKGGKTEKNTISDTGTENQPAKFMVCQGVSPKGPVSCSRTYFLSDFVNPFNGKELKVGELYKEDEETRVLTQIYATMIECVLEAINIYSSTLSVHKARALAVEKLCDECSRLNSPTINKYLQKRSNIVFSIDSYDNHGHLYETKDGVKCFMVKLASMTLTDIPSCVNPVKPIGSLLFSEVFIDSVLNVEKPDGTLVKNSEILYLTGHIPKYRSWTTVSDTGQISELHDRLKRDLNDKYGKTLMSGETVTFGSSRDICNPQIEGQLFVYKHGLAIFNPHTGAIVMMDSSNVLSLKLYDGDSMGVAPVLCVEMKVTMRHTIPAYLLSKDNIIYITFLPKTRACKIIYMEVFPVWKNDTQLPKIENISELPKAFTEIHLQIQNKFKNSGTASTTSIISPFTKASASLPHVDRFLSHMCASCCIDVPIAQSDLPAILNQQAVSSQDETVENEQKKSEQIIITVISGIDGSYKDSLCDTLQNVTRQKIRWTVLKQPLDSVQPFVPEGLQKSLKSVLQTERRHKYVSEDEAEQKPRVLVVTPGFMDIVDVVQAIVCHPDPNVRETFKIGAVTMCIDPLNSFMEHRLTFPYLLNYCAQGWVNNILATSSTSLKNSLLADVQELIRSVNSDVSFFLAEKGKMTRSTDTETVLSDSVFMEDRQVRARHLLCPGWSSGVYKSQDPTITLQSVIIRFYKPLERSLLLSKLKGLKNSLGCSPFTGNIYYVHGVVKFSGSPTAMEVHCRTIPQYITILPADNSYNQPKLHANGDGNHDDIQDNFVVFTGCQLKEKTLKDWLRTCAKQKPEKKKILSRKDLDKKDIEKIHAQHHLEALPAGWFYNGTQFVSFDGEKQDIHPSLEDFIINHIKEVNKGIEKYNADIENAANSFTDLFEN